jgi:hypothetical protein
VTGTWQPPERTAQAQAIYAAAEADRAQHPHKYALDPDALLAAALGDRSVAALGSDDWRDALATFAASAREDAELNALGLRMAAGSAIGRLRARLNIRDWFDRHPERLGARPEAPIFIIGGWRTGTTFLQRMLGCVPALRALYPWELAAPWKAAGITGDARTRLRASAQAAHDHLHLLNSRLQQVHDSGAHLPEECVLALGTTLRNWGFLSTMRLTRYAGWLESQDFSGEYRNYAGVLGMLDALDGRRFVLKAPAHTAELPHVLEAFPDATIVHLHRDVVDTVASGASLFAVFRSTYCDTVDASEVGAFQAHQTHLWFERARRFREACERTGRGHFVDVAYPDLVSDPMATVRAILDAAAIPWSDGLERELERYLADNRQHRLGTHQYSAEAFGLDAGELRERFR